MCRVMSLTFSRTDKSNMDEYYGADALRICNHQQQYCATPAMYHEQVCSHEHIVAMSPSTFLYDCMHDRTRVSTYNYAIHGRQVIHWNDIVCIVSIFLFAQYIQNCCEYIGNL
jgi:hypothetical protein